MPYSYCLGYFTTLELLTHRPDEVLRVVAHNRLSRERRDEIDRRCCELGLELQSDNALIEKYRHKGNIYLLAVFRKYHRPLDPAANHLMLVQASHPGNVGTLMRTMLAFHSTNLALLEPVVDPYSPHVIRASLGASFAVASETFDSLADYRERYLHTLYLFTPNARRSLESTQFREPYTLVFGPEWPGLPRALLPEGIPVSIPHSDLVESLNVAIAAGIALHQASKALTNR